MPETTKLGPWVRRFLLEHLVGERNLARNTQRSYRDTLALLIPFIADRVHKEIDQVELSHLSSERVHQFLQHLEENRGCSVTTRNQRLAAIHALAHFIGARGPENIEWCGQIQAVPFKRACQELDHVSGKARDGCAACSTGSQLQAGTARLLAALVPLQYWCSRR